MATVAQTTLSTKGQMIMPKDVRDRHNWGPGTKLEVVDSADGNGVTVREAAYKSPFPPTRLEDVAGCLKYKGPPLSLEDMDRAITTAIKRRRALGRY